LSLPTHDAPTQRRDPKYPYQRQHRHRPVNELRVFAFEASDSLIARARVRLGAGASSHHPAAFFLRASGSGHRPYGRFHDGWWGGLDESYESCQLPSWSWSWEQQWHQQAQEEQHDWH